jgi:nitronate monooxygenase
MRKILDKLAIPVIVAPMFLVSNPEMALAACAEGLLGSFPAHGTRDRETLERWLVQMTDGLQRMKDEGLEPAPFAVNLVVHPSNPRAEGDLELCVKYRVPMVLSSKGAPGEFVKRVHDYGGVVLHDVASRRHAEKALEANVDGVIAVAGGAGGHTGTINPFALVNEIRRIHQGTLVLAGGMTTGRDVLAAEAMGADLAYIGTRFIATEESSAPQAHKQMIVDSNSTEIFFSASVDGAPANWLTRSLLDAGVDLDELRTTLPGKIVTAAETRKRWKDIWTAGHSVGNIDDIPATAELCRRLKREYFAAQAAFGSRLAAQ